MSITKMNSLIFFVVLSNVFIKVLSDTGDTCGPVDSGMRDSNVCCDAGCTQCGEQYCSFEYDDFGNFTGSSEVSLKCCKSYIRRTSESCFECDGEGYTNDGECIGSCLTFVEDISPTYCNTTNSAPCIITHDDMILYDYKYENGGSSSSSSDVLTTVEIVWIVLGGIFFCALLSMCAGFGFYRLQRSEDQPETEPENDVERGVEQGS